MKPDTLTQIKRAIEQVARHSKSPVPKAFVATVPAALLGGTFGRMSRDTLRELAKSCGIRCGKDKADTISHLISSGLEFHVTVTGKGE